MKKPVVSDVVEKESLAASDAAENESLGGADVNMDGADDDDDDEDKTNEGTGSAMRTPSGGVATPVSVPSALTPPVAPAPDAGAGLSSCETEFASFPKGNTNMSV